MLRGLLKVSPEEFTSRVRENVLQLALSIRPVRRLSFCATVYTTLMCSQQRKAIVILLICRERKPWLPSTHTNSRFVNSQLLHKDIAPLLPHELMAIEFGAVIKSRARINEVGPLRTLHQTLPCRPGV